MVSLYRRKHHRTRFVHRLNQVAEPTKEPRGFAIRRRLVCRKIEILQDSFCKKRIRNGMQLKLRSRIFPHLYLFLLLFKVGTVGWDGEASVTTTNGVRRGYGSRWLVYLVLLSKLWDVPFFDNESKYRPLTPLLQHTKCRCVLVGREMGAWVAQGFWPRKSTPGL